MNAINLNRWRVAAFAIVCAAALPCALAQSVDAFHDPSDLRRTAGANLPKFGPGSNEPKAVLSDAVAGAIDGEALQRLITSVQRTKRGPAAVALFRRAASGVVLILTKEGSGSGSLLTTDGVILTNWHIVRGKTEAGVIFKPLDEAGQPVSADMVRARVLRFDEVADLALLKVDAVPAWASALALGTADQLSVGSDVHAIGHPRGLYWSYTQGVVSQRRMGYQWSDGVKSHVANVVQTQAPISPGNSGGPLLDSDGLLIGVNSFNKTDAQNLNFAVSVDEVRRFLSVRENRYAAAASAVATGQLEAQTVASCAGPRQMYSGRNSAGVDVVGYDTRCTGRADLETRTPQDISLPVTAAFDRNGDGKTDILIFSPARDGKWLYSFHDNDFDGQWDLVGHHPDGSMLARRFESYAVWEARRSK
jgi:S1-C subfamily serine protease